MVSLADLMTDLAKFEQMSNSGAENDLGSLLEMFGGGGSGGIASNEAGGTDIDNDMKML